MGICRSCVFVAPPRPAALVLLGWWEMRKGRGRERRWKDGTVRGLGGSLSFLDTRALVFSFFGYTA
jgi:hypothetical protein